MSTNKTLQFRGQPSAFSSANDGKQIFFTTRHPENSQKNHTFSTALYRLDLEKSALDEFALPSDGHALVQLGDMLWLLGSNGQLYKTKAEKPALKEVGDTITGAHSLLALQKNGQLIVATHDAVLILDAKAKPVQNFAFEARPTAIAVSSDGQWLTVGDQQGNVHVFTCEGKSEFQLSESAKLHNGHVTQLCFSADELRFLSSGRDQTLLLTHARGALQPEDRGRNNGHDKAFSAIVWGEQERFYTTSTDGTIKAWLKTGNTKPFTVRDGVGKVTHACLCQQNGKPHLLIATSDNSLRLLLLDASGKPANEISQRYDDAYAWADAQQNGSVKDREAAQDLLATFDDQRALEALQSSLKNDIDAKLRLRAAQKLSASANRNVQPILEKAFKHSDEAVTITAFRGLRDLLGESDLGPLEKALDSGSTALGKLAIDALLPLAAKNQQAAELLTQSINRKPYDVREAGLFALEQHFSKQKKIAELYAVQASEHADLRRFALIRLYQRGLLDDAKTKLVLPDIAAQDKDAQVRRTAWLVSILSRPKLADALRRRDKDLHRQLHDIETWGDDKAELPRVARAKVELDDDDYAVPLQAMTSPALDTCLAGTRALAQLGDPRAFGLLLQLSRESDTGARVEVCRALGELDDARANQRLRSLLNDNAEQVRDAAFSALLDVAGKQPLTASQFGFDCDFEDVRRRALSVLIKNIKTQIKDAQSNKKQRPTLADDHSAGDFDPTSIALLQRALNDKARSVHQDAFKAVLNQELGQNPAHTLQFLLSSHQAELRQEVLTEIMAQHQADWAWPMLLGLLDDADANIRSQAFEFASTKYRSQREQLWQKGIESEHLDIRQATLDAASKRQDSAAQAILLTALNDADPQLRLKALKNFVLRSHVDGLQQALQSQHLDVRLAAANALATTGDTNTFAVFAAQLAEPEPLGADASDHDKKQWQQLTIMALGGLAELGQLDGKKEADTLDRVSALTQHSNADLRCTAVATLVWFGDCATTALHDAARDKDDTVRSLAAFGQAIAGDSKQTFSLQQTDKLPAQHQIVAALNAGISGETWLAQQLDNKEASLRDNALLIMLLLELKHASAVPNRALDALASAYPSVRLAAARLLEHYADPKNLLQAVTDSNNDRGLEGQDQKAWDLSADTFDTLGNIFAFGTPQLQFKAAALLALLNDEHIDNFKAYWHNLSQRFDKELKALAKTAKAHKGEKSAFDANELANLAFGSYVGLLRPAAGRRNTTDATLAQRQTAIRQLSALAIQDKNLINQAWPVLLGSLNDRSGALRELAYNNLELLAKGNKTRAAELTAHTLHSGHADIGLRALRLSIKTKAGLAQAETAMLERTDGLQNAAVTLLVEEKGIVYTHSRAIHARDRSLRHNAISALAQHYDDKTAQAALIEAAQSDWKDIRGNAAAALANHKHPQAGELLHSLLLAEDGRWQQCSLVDQLANYDRSLVAGAVCDRIENDPRNNVDTGILNRIQADMLDKSNLDRLFALTEHPKHADFVACALLRLSGFDQSIQDRDDSLVEGVDNWNWQSKQRPRNSALYLRLLQTLLEQASRQSVKTAEKRLGHSMDSLYWLAESDGDNSGEAANSLLAELCTYPEDNIRHSAIQAAGWRLEKRASNTAKGKKAKTALTNILQSVLKSKQPADQLFAAEGLARIADSSGLPVLLSAIDYWDELHYRQRATIALGKTKDPRALDKLLQLAADPEHALQSHASHALARLGERLHQEAEDSPAFEEVMQLLTQAVERDHVDDLYTGALGGLRFVGHPRAWQLLQQRIDHGHWRIREIVARDLGYHDDDTSRQLLLERLSGKENDYNVHCALLLSARRSFGAESLEPDYATLQSYCNYDVIYERLPQTDPEKLLQIYADIRLDVYHAAASQHILAAEPAPVDAAFALLSSNATANILISAQILSGLSKAKKAQQTQLSEAVERQIAHLQETFNENQDVYGDQHTAVQQLLWTACKLGVTDAALALLEKNDKCWDIYRLSILQAISAHGDIETELLQNLCSDNNTAIAQLAQATLANRSSAQAQAQLASNLNSRGQIQRLGQGEYGSLSDNVDQRHYQGTVLPFAIKTGKHQPLVDCANNTDLEEDTRLSAIEALAQLTDAKAQKAAQKALAEIGNNDKNADSLRKAAWRARRRSLRLAS